MTPAAPRFAPARIIPTPEQLAIQLARGRVTLVEANAGAAKTTTLALRIGEALARGLAPEAILALTFTEPAREVLRARLIEIDIPYATAKRVRVQTLDEFAQEALRAIEDTVPPALDSDQDLKLAALEALETVSTTYTHLAERLDIRTHNVAASQFLDTLLRLKASMALAHTGADSELADEYDDAYLDASDPESIAEALGTTLTDYLWAQEYERLRRGALDGVRFRGSFDATYDLACLLRSDPSVVHALPACRLVLGDELHDLNEASFRVIEALLSRDGVWFVGAGDSDQVIHTQRGADLQYLARRFVQRFKHTAALPLTLTWRHGPHLAAAMAAFKNKTVQAALPLPTRIVEAGYDATQPSACAAAVVATLRAWKAEKHPLQHCAILLRNPHQSIAVENALMQAHIGYRTGILSSYLRREEILFLRGMLAIALGNLAAVQSAPLREAIVEALAFFGEVPLSDQDLTQARRTIAQEPAALHYFFQGQILRVSPAAASARIRRAVETVQALPPDTPAGKALERLCEQIDMRTLARRLYVHPRDANVINRSVDGFIRMAHESGKNLRQLTDWLGTADAYVDTRRRKDLVYLDYVEHAKGQEFEHVLLPYLASDEFPDPLGDVRAEDNLFYVAATRARTRLSLFVPDDLSRRSPFVARMKLTEARAKAKAAMAP